MKYNENTGSLDVEVLVSSFTGLRFCSYIQ